VVKKDTRSSENRPYCFVSYSSREPHVNLLLECVGILFSGHYKIEITPSGLIAGASQRDRITELIAGCSFGIVCLDGLRPNVTFEYGMLHAQNKPVILMREKDAEVDIRGFLRDTVGSPFEAVRLDINTQFSNVKDVNYATWHRYSFTRTMSTLWEEFSKRKTDIRPYIEIPKPKEVPNLEW
jgi:hypothetical protein